MIDGLLEKLAALDAERRAEIAHYLRMEAEHLRAALGPYRESAGISALHRASLEVEQSAVFETSQDRVRKVIAEACDAGRNAEREAVVAWLQKQGGRPAWSLTGEITRGVHRWEQK